MADEDEIILTDLDDDELVQQMHDDLYDGLQEEKQALKCSIVAGHLRGSDQGSG